MKKILVLLSVLGLLTACSSTANAETTNPPTPTTEETTVKTDAKTGLPIDPSDNLIQFTLDDLAKYDGKNGQDAYVAIDGKVYDVTGDRKWKDGNHYEGMVAGQDLSAFIASAPHGVDILKGYTVIGKLVQ